MIPKILYKNLYTNQIIIKNTFWLAMSEGVSRLLKLLLIICVARTLGVVEYGKFYFALSFVSIFIVFSDLGVSSITTRELAKNQENENNYPAILSLKIILGFIALLLIIIGSFFITFDPNIKKLIWILAVYITATNFAEIIYAFFRAKQKMQYEALAKILQSILITTIGIFTIYNFPSVNNLTLSYLSGALIALTCTLIFFHFKVFPIKFSIQLSVWKNFLQNAWPIGTSTILGVIPIYSGPVIMGTLGLISEVGWYGAAGKIISILVIPSIIISQSFYPALSKSFKESKEALQRAWNYQIELSAFIFIPLILVTMTLSQKIINFVYGPSFVNSILVLKILIPAIGFIYLNNIFFQILVIFNQQKKAIIIASCGAIIAVILNLILIPKFGLYGMALTALIVNISNFLFLLGFFLKFSSIKLLNSKNILSFFGAIISSIPIYFAISNPQIYNLNIIISIIILIGIYLISIIIYKNFINYYNNILRYIVSK